MPHRWLSTTAPQPAAFPLHFERQLDSVRRNLQSFLDKTLSLIIIKHLPLLSEFAVPLDPPSGSPHLLPLNKHCLLPNTPSVSVCSWVLFVSQLGISRGIVGIFVKYLNNNLTSVSVCPWTVCFHQLQEALAERCWGRPWKRKRCFCSPVPLGEFQPVFAKGMLLMDLTSGLAFSSF